MKKIISILAIIISLNVSAQQKADTTLTDSTEFLSIKDISIAIYSAGKGIEDKFTKKQWDDIMNELEKNFNAVIQNAAGRYKNRKQKAKN